MPRIPASCNKRVGTLEMPRLTSPRWNPSRAWDVAGKESVPRVGTAVSFRNGGARGSSWPSLAFQTRIVELGGGMPVNERKKGRTASLKPACYSLYSRAATFVRLFKPLLFILTTACLPAWPQWGVRAELGVSGGGREGESDAIFETRYAW